MASPKQGEPKDLPLRPIRRMVEEALKVLMHRSMSSTLILPQSDCNCRPGVVLKRTVPLALGNARLCKRNPSLVTKAYWEALARACDVRTEFLLGLVDEMVGRLREALAPVREAFEAEAGEHPALQRIEQVIDNQIRRTTRS